MNNRLNTLITKLCPSGVRYKKISDVVSVERGKRVIRSQLPESGKYSVYQNSCKPLGFIDEYNYKGNKAFIIGAGAAGEIGYSRDDFWAADDCYPLVCSEEISDRFIYHYLLSRKGYIESQVRKGSIPRLSRSVIEKMLIPVPPIEVQREIVQILDNFTSLTSELTEKLTSELISRKQQYDYYASKLFSECNSEWVELSEVAEFVYGYTDKAKDEGDTRFIRITDINEQGYLKDSEKKYITLNEEAKKSLLKKGDLIMARTGATYGKTLYFDSDFPSVYASFLIKIIPNKRLLSKYYWHFTKTALYWDQANRLVTTGGQPQFNSPAVKKIRIPLPSIDEQQCVVKILDKLDKLINTLAEDIPAEIAAREKQYEYYRDLLMSIKEISV